MIINCQLNFTTDWLFQDTLIPEAVSICKKCIAPKPPRTHHCSVCNRCVLKMDHHCRILQPWFTFTLLNLLFKLGTASSWEFSHAFFIITNCSFRKLKLQVFTSATLGRKGNDMDKLLRQGFTRMDTKGTRTVSFEKNCTKAAEKSPIDLALHQTKNFLVGSFPSPFVSSSSVQPMGKEMACSKTKHNDNTC